MSAPLHKPDPAILGPIDDRLRARLTDPVLEEGVAYWRWASYDRLLEPDMIANIVRDTEAVGYYSGMMVGKPLTAFFYYPAFP